MAVETAVAELGTFKFAQKLLHHNGIQHHSSTTVKSIQLNNLIASQPLQTIYFNLEYHTSDNKIKILDVHPNDHLLLHFSFSQFFSSSFSFSSKNSVSWFSSHITPSALILNCRSSHAKNYPFEFCMLQKTKRY